MHNSQSRTTLFSLLASVIGAKVTKTTTSFLEIWYNYSNNGTFYCNCSILSGSNYVPLRLINFRFYYFFFIHFIRLGSIDSGSGSGAILPTLSLIILAAVFFFSRQVFATNFKLLEQGRTVKIYDNFEPRGLGSST